ncbi:MAG: ABC transporter permease [Chryseolinea sp.]
MFKSYLRIAIRNLSSNKTFSCINIGGLAVGITACALIMLYVKDEMSYDKYHQHGDRVFRISSEVKGEKWVASPAPMADGIKRDFPEVEEVTRLLRFPGAEKMLLKDDRTKKQFFETNAYYVDSTYFQLFTYDLKFGNEKDALRGPNSIAISEDVAAKFFGDENPVGRILNVGLSFGTFDYTVKAVFRQKNKSHIPANLLLSMNNGDVGGWVKAQTNWAANSIFHTYVKLHEGIAPKSFQAKLADFLQRNGGADFKAAGFEKTLFLQPLEDIYLHSDYGYEVAPNGNARFLYVFTSIALFILALACINFMNLSTARSEKRAREVGMRKVSGASRNSLIAQFMTESMLMSLFALAFAFIMIQLLIPVFNQLTQKDLSLQDGSYNYLLLISLTTATGLLSGIYPALYLSSFKPSAVLKGKVLNTISAISIRKGLVIFQFTISVVLILGAILIRQQMQYLGNQNLGFSKGQKIILPIQTAEASKNSQVLKTKLLGYPEVLSAAVAGSYPGIETVTSILFYAEGKVPTDNVDITTTYVEADYLKTLGIKLLRGRTFAEEFLNDEQSIVINEAAVRQLGYTIDDAVGKKVNYDFQNQPNPMTIIGIVKDYHFQSLQQEIKPLALTIAPFFSGPNRFLIADVSTTHYPDLIRNIQSTWATVNGGSPFNYSFLDQDFQKNYEKEKRTSLLIQYFTFIAIAIACLGLFGLATFTTEQRIKEIGVRKVLGASVGQIVAHLSTGFMSLVIISIFISIPIAYFFMQKWLQNFAYHVEIQWWIFAVGSSIALLIALLTISLQTVKAAMENPVKSLRSE